MEVHSGTPAARQRRTDLQQEEHQASLARLREAVHELRAAQARAAALWGRKAKAPLRDVFSHIGKYEVAVLMYWPGAQAVAKHLDNQPQPPKNVPRQPAVAALERVVFGHEADTTGTKFEDAASTAEQWYEKHVRRDVGRVKRGGDGGAA